MRCLLIVQILHIETLEHTIIVWYLISFRSKENSSEVEEFDQHAAFFTQVVSKKKKVGSVHEQPTGGKGKSKGGDKAKEEDVC